MSRHLTPNLGLPYYDGDDPPDGAAQQQDLAQTLDTGIGAGGVPPVGVMFMWPSAVAPTGYLLMQGQQVDAATYPKLATLLGQVGGMVTIPDMRDRFPVGAGPTMALGATGGASSVTLTTATMPSHAHGGTTGARDRSQIHGHNLQNGAWSTGAVSGQPAGPFGVTGSGAGSTLDADPADHLHTIGAEGGGQAHENRPPFRGVNFIIRAG